MTKEEPEKDAARLARLEAAVRNQPMNSEAWCELGQAYHQLEQHELAVCVLRRATALGGCGRDWYYLSKSLASLGAWAPALDAARRAVALGPDEVAGLLNLGWQLVANGKPAEAVRHLERATGLDPHSRAPVRALGIARFRAADFAAAAGDLEESLRREPDDPLVWAYLGASLDELDRPQEAVHALESALFAKPDDGWTWARLGKALRALGRHDEAVRAYEKAVEHAFTPPVVWRDMGESAAEVRNLASLERACNGLKPLDAGLARTLRRRLRSLTTEARAGAPAAEAPAAKAEEKSG